MDIETALKLSKEIEDYWAKLPQRQVVHEKRAGYQLFTIAFMAGKLKVLLRIVLGPRLGLKEAVYVVDSQAKVAADRLILCQPPNYDTYFVATITLREHIRLKPGESATLCAEALKQSMEAVEADPDRFENSARSAARQEGQSISAVSGGLPGSGLGGVGRC